AWVGTGYFENNHFIGFSPASLSSVYDIESGVTPTITNNGDEVFQTTAVASGQGYVASNNYAPTAAINATVNAGANLTSSCSTFSSDSALCYGTSDGASGTGGLLIYPTIPIIARPTTGAWDAGAYEYQSGTPQAPTPTFNPTSGYSGPATSVTITAAGA